MSYKDVKEAMHKTMGLDPEIEKISSDVDLLAAYHTCKWISCADPVKGCVLSLMPRECA